MKKFRRTALEALKWCGVAYLLCDAWLACTQTLQWPEVLFILGGGPVFCLAMLFETQLRALGLMTSPGWFSFPTTGGLILVAAGAYAVVFLAVWLLGGRRK